MPTVIVITGATSGIGRAAAMAFASRGDVTLVLIGRNRGRGLGLKRLIEQRHSNVRAFFVEADLSVLEEARRVAEKIAQQFRRVNVLVNNAGARFDAFGETREGIEQTFATNHLGHFVLTLNLLDCLAESGNGRVISVSSSAHWAARVCDPNDWMMTADNFDRKQAYARSKFANIVFAFELAKQLKGLPVVSNAVDPGVVATRFALNNGVVAWTRHTLSHWLRRELVSAATAAETIHYLAAEPEPQTITGQLFRDRQVTDPLPEARDPRIASGLWNESVKLAGDWLPERFSCGYA